MTFSETGHRPGQPRRTASARRDAVALAATAQPAPRRTALAWLLAVALVATTLVTGARPAAATGPSTADFLAAVNASRAAAGLRPYTLRSDLSSVAYSWAKHMASTGSLAHNPSLSRQVTNWSYLGENVGYGPDWRTIENAFMASPGHRANILDHDFTEIGIGVVVSGGRMWVTQDFRRPAHATSTTTTASAPTRTTKKTTARPAAKKTTTRPAAKPAARPVAKPAPAPAATPQEQLLSRIRDASRTLPATPAGDPVAQAVAYVRSMDIVTG